VTSDTPGSPYTDGTIPADADLEQGDTDAAAETTAAAGVSTAPEDDGTADTER
jgi:hypothetical protein